MNSRELEREIDRYNIHDEHTSNNIYMYHVYSIKGLTGKGLDYAHPLVFDSVSHIRWVSSIMSCIQWE